VNCAEVQRHHILVVGDDSDTCVLYREILEGEGYRVSHAAMSDWQLAVCGSAAPDLILFDLEFSEGDQTADFQARLSAALPTASIPVLVCSTHHTLLASWHAELSAQGGGSLYKPFDLEALLTAVLTSVSAREKVADGR
jgi:CheY-like chemotaxis protein